ncbi:RecQ family ATP-dependent DNA helicase [Luteirhabdus pelagi]|uniref:RecQ family ATP-dependent DNA helicase n=1 Tax=Luteirhabdus pelagi TaxID=2792783 RepID=UPI00193ACDAE|nr:ATP-dependent DNA helicase RecQ [Luteirhabdus pelagi]
MERPINILEQYWGYPNFRPLQEDIIESVLNGQDTVALLPTGGGKSICFQVPTLCQEGICIVVSPLVALMANQVKALQDKGIKALHISGGIAANDLQRLLENALYGKYKFLYLSPERLQQEIVQQWIEKLPVSLIAIDEAHCISQWGNDFRPAYRNIHVLRELHPLVPMMALTATATPAVLEDTVKQLQLELPKVFKKSFVRDNLAYRTKIIEDKLAFAEKLLKQKPGAAIIYVRSRKATVNTSNHLNTLGIRSTFFHGGLPRREKEDRLEQWLSGSVPVMVATNAFGMGIDHPQVRYVFHFQLPESLESYFQEAGRAGRDGNYAQAFLLYSEYDKNLVKQRFVDTLPSVKEVKKLYRKLNNYFQISYGEGEFTEHNFNFSKFCETYSLNTLLTYNGLNTLDRLGIIQLSQQFGRSSTVQFVVPSNAVLRYFEGKANISVVGKTLLRMYGGIFETPSSVDLELLSNKTGQSVSFCIEALQQLERDGIIELNLRTTDASITFLTPREDDRTINVVAKYIKEQHTKKKQQVADMLQYVTNDSVCKSVQLVSYFGEEDAEACGICSVCAPEQKIPQKREVQLIAEKILILLEERDMDARELSQKTTFAEAKVVHTLRKLLDAKKIAVNARNQYTLL